MPTFSDGELGIDVASNLLRDIADHLQFIIFDCDGVLIDSNNLKTDAFRKTLDAYPSEMVDNFVVYHEREGGVSRYVKLGKFVADLDIPDAAKPDLIRELLERFSGCCRALYAEAELTPGCQEVLARLSGRYNLYVASGSDEQELRDVFALRGLDGFFQDIFGSPKTKSQCVGEVMKMWPDGRGMFVGDARSDFNAARDAGLSFVFMRRFSQAKALESEFVKCGAEVIETLCELEHLIDLEAAP